MNDKMPVGDAVVALVEDGEYDPLRLQPVEGTVRAITASTSSASNSPSTTISPCR